MSALAKLFVEVGANVNGFERGMKQVRSDIDRTANHASFFSNTMSNAIGFGIANAVNRGVSALSNLTKSVISTGIGFNALEQNSTIAFETMLGSVDKAKKFLDDLKKFAKATPFELPGLIESSQRLLAFGFQSDKIIPMMTSIGDAVAGLGGSPEKLNRVILAFGQIQAKGRVMAGEMLQLTEAGIPAWDMLAKKIGVSIPEAMKLSEKGMIDSQTAINAILEGMNSKFGGLMSKQALAWSGMVSNIKDTFTQVTGRVMKPFFDLGLKVMTRLLELFNSPVFEAFVQRMTKGSQALANFLGKIGKMIVGIFTGDYRTFFDGLFGGFFKLDNILQKYENKRFGFLSNFTPKEALTAIKGFITDLKHGGKNLDYWISHTPRLLQPLEKLAIAGLKVWNYISGEGIQTSLKSLSKIVMGLGGTLGKLVRPFKDALGSLFQQLSNAKNLGFSDIFKAILSSIAQAFMGFIKIVQNDFWPTIKSALVWVWNALSEFVSSINWSSVWNGVVGVVSGLLDFIKSIDWNSIGATIVYLFKSVVDYVSSINWSAVWSNIWNGLTAVGTFISENVFPIFSNFFSWLLSWFTDSSKNQQLLNTISTVWTFIADWANSIASAVTPYFTSFFSWLFSWFTDTQKSQQLWSAITVTWNFITEWAKQLWNWISPYLTSFFTSLSTWISDPTKRQTLWNGIVSTWNFITEWSKQLWTWISPYLASFWSSIIGWVTDPAKRQMLWNGVSSGWTVFTTWAGSLWGWIYPHLSNFYSSLISWLDSTRPGLGQATQQLAQTTTSWIGDALSQFRTNLPLMGQSVIDLKNTIINEIPMIAEAMSRLYKAMFGDGSSGSEFANKITWFFNTISKAIGTVITQARIMIEVFAIMIEATKAAFSGDFNTYIQKSMEFGSKIDEFNRSVSEQWNQFSQLWSNAPQGHARGGITQGGSVLVGERGAELVDLPRGSRVWDAGQTRGKLSGGSTQQIEITINNNGKLDIDRKTIDEIAMQLMRKLNMQGNRYVLAN